MVRNWRLLYVSPETLVTIFAALNGPGFDCIVLPRFPDLPPDVRVLEINYDACRRAFSLLLESARFETVPDGETIPAFPGFQHFVMEKISPKYRPFVARIKEKPNGGQ